MDGDFERLVSHDKYCGILKEYLKYRIGGKITLSLINDVISSIASKKINSISAINEINKLISTYSNNSNYIDTLSKQNIKDINNYESIIKNNIKNVLDISGCNEYLTGLLGTHIGLDKSNIITTNVIECTHSSDIKTAHKNITFIPMGDNKKLPLTNGSMDLIIANMILHCLQIDDLIKILSEITRCIKDDGLLYLREYDSPNKMIDSIINIDRCLLNSINKTTQDDNFQKNYCAQYKPAYEWINLMLLYGFEQIGNIVITSKYTRTFTALFRKNTHIKILDNMSIASSRSIAKNMGIKTTNISGGKALRHSIVSGLRIK
jgi:ubiquinone/menaquinone biosynthesis C-methylase UbiE